MTLTIVNTAQAALWDGEVGAHWATHADRYDAIMHAFDGALFAAAGIGASDRVLDIGCGTGHTTRLAARRAAQGHAVGIDLSGAMLERARARSAAHGLANVSFVQGDAQVYPFPLADFDVAISRGGVMFFADHAAAFATIRRALLPAGRLAFVCPQPPRPDGDTARAFAPLNALKLEHAPAQPQAADLARAMSSLADPADIRRILAAAGWVDVTVAPVEAPMHWGADAADAAEFVLASGPVRVDLDALSAPVLARLRSRARALLRPYETQDGVRISGAVWLVTATAAG